MGLNAIFLFVGSGLFSRVLIKITVGSGENALAVQTWIYKYYFSCWAGNLNGSLLFAIRNILFWWLILDIMYRRRWVIKL
ncbi:N-acetylglucosamine related transporter, NagX [Richelia intracellularis]|nr:N-acetylglucosamine related transporter, NagX [Richelia intracellularis]